MDPLTIIALINAGAPLISNIITFFRHKDGTVTAVVYLDDADGTATATQTAIGQWFASKGKPVPGAAPLASA